MSNVSTVTQCSQVLNSPFPRSHKQHWNTTLKNCCQIQYLSIYLQDDIYAHSREVNFQNALRWCLCSKFIVVWKLKKTTFRTCWQLFTMYSQARAWNLFKITKQLLINININRQVHCVITCNAIWWKEHTHAHIHTHTPRWKINIIEQTTCIQYLARLKAYI